MIKKKKASEIEKMRVAGAVVGNCLRELAAWIEPGKTTTLEMDKKADELVRSYGAVPSFKNYNGYPNSVCIAVNEEVVHGIPGGRVLMPGDVVGIDLGAIVDGWHGDSAITVLVDDCGSNEARKLLQVTRDALYKGIEQARPGKRLSDIGHAVQEYVEDAGFSVVRDLVGHGIGRNMHEEPYVPNDGRPGKGIRLEEGMVLAIEPMVNIGGYEVETLADGWTVVTADGSLSAHFEHTVAIRRDGPDILTLPKSKEA